MFGLELGETSGEKAQRSKRGYERNRRGSRGPGAWDLGRRGTVKGSQRDSSSSAVAHLHRTLLLLSSTGLGTATSLPVATGWRIDSVILFVAPFQCRSANPVREFAGKARCRRRRRAKSLGGRERTFERGVGGRPLSLRASLGPSEGWRQLARPDMFGWNSIMIAVRDTDDSWGARGAVEEKEISQFGRVSCVYIF